MKNKSDIKPKKNFAKALARFYNKDHEAQEKKIIRKQLDFAKRLKEIHD